MEAFNAIILAMDLSEAKVIIKMLNSIVVNLSGPNAICDYAI